MLDGNNEAKPSVQESYAGAVSDGRSRVEPHKVTRADLIASAGMSIYGTGTALMRLVSEWQSGAAPRDLAEVPDVKVLARQAAVARADSGILASEEEYGGMPVSAKRERRSAAPVLKHEAEFAQAEHRRLQAQATDWHLHENMLRFQRLKTLPTVRAALLHWVTAREWDDGEYLVAKVLQYFLSPYCPACGGSGVREFAGNNRRGAGKPCLKCLARKRDGIRCPMGEMPVPCHGRGRALLAHIRACTARAAKDVGEGARQRRRGEQSEEDRAKHKHHEQVAKLQRADAEDRAGEGNDNGAVAEHFRKSMVKTRWKE